MKESVLKNGVMDLYITFETFDNSKHTINDIFNKTFPTSLNKLLKSDLIISYDTFNKEIGLNHAFTSYLKKRKEEYLQPTWKLKKNHFLLEFQSVTPDYKSFDNFGGNYNISFSSNEGRTIDLLDYSQLRARNQFTDSLSYEEIYSGVDTLDIKKNYMLFPIKIIFTSGKVGFIDLAITIFKHGYCYVNASLRIENILISTLSTSMLDLPIEAAFLPNFMFNSDSGNDKYEYKKIGGCNNLDEAMSRYISYIQNDVFQHISKIEKFTSLTLLEMDTIPKMFCTEFLEKKDDFNKDIYSLLFAPVQIDRKLTKLDFNNLHNKLLIPTSEVACYANENRFIFVLSKNELNLSKASSKNNDEPVSKGMLLEAQYSSYRQSIPFILEKILLKKYSSLKNFIDLLSSKKLTELKKIKELRNFELGFEELPLFYNYGSTKIFFKFLYECCIDPNTTKVIDESIQRNEDLIILNKQIQTDRLSYSSAIFALIFTALFSINGIKDILNLFGNKDITTIRYSYIILFIFVIIIIIYIFKDKFKDKFIHYKNNFLNSKFKKYLIKLQHLVFKLFFPF